MTRRNLPTILLLNLLGIILFLSWYLPTNHGVWFKIDSAIFFYFNQHLLSSPTFLHLVAITNHRAFDVISLMCMGLLYFSFYIKETPAGRRRLIVIGFVMLLTAVILNQLGHLLPVSHPSPTLTFDNINRVSVLTGVPTKDASSDSFPGDHGMMLIYFCLFYVALFFPRCVRYCAADRGYLLNAAHHDWRTLVYRYRGRITLNRLGRDQLDIADAVKR